MKNLFSLFFLLCILLFPFTNATCAGGAQAASSATRGQYLAEQGIVIPPEEIHIDSYIASINYVYPMPSSELGVHLYNSTYQMSALGQEGLLHIGIQGRQENFEDLPPMNLAFVIDASTSMNEQDKIEWVKEAMEIVLGKIRDIDYISLITFNDTAQVIFETTRMDSPEKRQRFLEAVRNISPQGSANLEAGLTEGYQQLLANFREGSVNRLLFFSDGTEFSQRLSREAAYQSGDVRVSLIWENRNDLDLYVDTPLGETIYFGSRRDSTGGFLDVDMNVRGESTKPIENIVWPLGMAEEGTYRVYVRNYAYHERNREAFNFQIEIRNGNNYSSFERTISGTGRNSQVDVTSFDYRGRTAIQREKALVYQMAESFRELGITTSTFGVGIGFDLELMRNLAEEGGGSSRFLRNRQEMITTFDTEFERTIALAARDLEMVLEFNEGIEILETWGYQHRINDNRIYYRLTGLHVGDYETILVRYRLLPTSLRGERLLANFTVNARNILGLSLPAVNESIYVNFSETPLDGISSGKILYSGTMLHFAEALRDIGYLYYEGRTLQNSLERFTLSLSSTLSTRNELENAQLRLDDMESFSDELEILASYENLFRRHIASSGGASDVSLLPPIGINTLPPDMAVLQNRLASLFNEISLSFTEPTAPIAALSSFSLRDGSDPPLVSYLNQSAIGFLADSSRLRLVERERLDLVLYEQGIHYSNLFDADAAISLGQLLGAAYIITGQIIPMGSHVIVFGRVIHVETGEIVSAAQVFLDRDILGDLI